MDNFYIKLHIGAETPFYQQKDVEFKTEFYKDSKLFPYNEFDSETLKNICFRQLLHSYVLCEGMPLKVDLTLDKEALKCRVSELKELYKGTFDSETDWRLAIGLGNTSVFNTSITLHYIYGIPYIPATAVKGILRSWIITEYFSKDGEDLKNAECEALQELDFCKIFGAPDFCENGNTKTAIATNLKKDAYMGDIVFFDAFPINSPIIEVDVMNPHYPDYYEDDEGRTPPADWQNPKPIFFLTVTETSFQFLFGIRKGRKSFNVEFGEHKGNVISVLKNLLIEALSNHGIGAKTAAGYGRMTKMN